MFYHSNMPTFPLKALSIVSALTLAFAPPLASTGHAAPLIVPFVMPDNEPGLVDFSLEQLSDIVISSVSRQATRLADAPASIYSISAAEIRRAGAATLPEALRLAPNLQVARSDSHSYAITARGFSSTIENKLLVLIDGRSVYSPLFSGVFWDMQDVLMEDIERIEVISGPGATIWGANAVNGVINIITRGAAETQGNLLALEAGGPERHAAIRHGGQLAGGGYYRAYLKTDQFDASDNPDGSSGDNGWRRSQLGFRADWNNATRELTVSGDAYSGSMAQAASTPITIGGANLLGRVNWKLGGGESLRLQAYLDHTERNQPNTGAQHLDTFDLEAQHGVTLAAIHQLVWGAGLRYSRDRMQNGPFLQFTPAERNLSWGNLFAQDEIALAPDWRLTLGLKAERNSYTGLELLPNLRLAFNASPTSLLWGALSRTVRAPSRIDRELFVRNPSAAPGAAPYSIAAGPDFISETARVLEVGYRSQPMPELFWSAAAFYSDYDRLRTLEPGSGLGPVFSNMGQGSTRGIELSARWQVMPRWRMTGGLVVQDIATDVKPGSQDASGATGLATNDPSSYWSLRSSHEISPELQADFTLRRVGALPQPAVPGYYELDGRFAWQLRPNLDLALNGHNLLHARHAEFGRALTRQQFERTLSLKLELRF
jgi:iron complex outermembrane receptor protein